MKSDYYMWLLSKVGIDRGDNSDYTKLLDLLFSTDYEYAFIMDQNRAKAGENLRSVYALETGLYLDDVHQGPCNILEMLVALSDTMAFETSSTTAYWFWVFLGNLGLDVFDDSYFDEDYILSRLNEWMNHEYEFDGTGSLFPLKNPPCDQRGVEIWNQMNAYLVENYPVGNWIE